MEHKNLVLRHGEASDAALGAAKKAVFQEDELKRLQSDCDKLSAELSEVKESYDAFRFARAQEYDTMLAEVRVRASAMVFRTE